MMCVYLSTCYAEDECSERGKGSGLRDYKKYIGVLLFVGYFYLWGSYI